MQLFVNKTSERLIELALALFGIFILVQLIIKILGGSWSTEDIMIALLVFNLGSLFTLGLMFAQLRADHDHLKGQFGTMANDFKVFMGKNKRGRQWIAISRQL